MEVVRVGNRRMVTKEEWAGLTRDAETAISRSMKTTIDIPKDELEDAIRFSGAATKKEAVLAALADFNRRKRMAALVKHAGSSNTMATNEEIEASELRRQSRMKT